MLSVSSSHTQTLLARRAPVFVNNGVDMDDSTIVTIVQLWKDYLNSNPDSSHDNPYWSVSEKKRYPNADLASEARFPLYQLAANYKPTILSVSQEDSCWRIRTIFAAQGDSGFTNPLAITDVLARVENGNWKLFNTLDANTRSWQRHRIRNVTFCSPPHYRYHPRDAARLVQFTDSLRRIWGLPERPVTYLCTESEDEAQQAVGLVYAMGYGNRDAPGGRADWHNGIVYGGGLGEYFPHEFVHVYINPLFPNANPYFIEGYATYLGGERGRSLHQLCIEADKYFSAHPEVNFDSVIASEFPVDFTRMLGSVYIFGGIICKRAELAGGLGMLRKLFAYPPDGPGLSQALRDLFGVKEGQINRWLREQIHDEAIGADSNRR